jgi:hypothetical protein
MKLMVTVVGVVVYVFTWGMFIMVLSAGLFLFGRWCAKFFGWY